MELVKLISEIITSLLLLLIFILIIHNNSRKRAKQINALNIIKLQTDGFDFILYKGQITEMVTDHQRFIGVLDIIIYSRSLFIGFAEPRHTYLDLSGKAIQSVKYEPNKITITCFKELTGISKIVLKGSSIKQLYIISKKIDFISRRSKKVTAI